MKRGLILAIVVFAALLGARLTPAQTGAGTLSGVVLGPDDKPVPNASITYQSGGGRAPHIVHTDSKGHFSITRLKMDNYDLRASAKGIFSEWEKNVMVRSGKTQFITLRLIYAREMPKPDAANQSNR
jgi:carboxypeptidase family protein